MGVTSFQQSLYEFFDSGLLFRIALLQKTILFLLALGHVWRDSYVPQTDATSREERYWCLVDAIKSKTSHFRIFDWHAVYRVNMTDYAHHADSSNVLHGMQALVAISDGADSLDCAAMAIGQSRHLGGGFWCRLIFT